MRQNTWWKELKLTGSAGCNNTCRSIQAFPKRLGWGTTTRLHWKTSPAGMESTVMDKFGAFRISQLPGFYLPIRAEDDMDWIKAYKALTPKQHLWIFQVNSNKKVLSSSWAINYKKIWILVLKELKLKSIKAWKIKRKDTYNKKLSLKMQTF